MLGWDRNPLRRRIDRVEAAVVAGLIAVFLISAPVLGAAAGTPRPPLRHSQVQAHTALAEWLTALVLGLLLCLAVGVERVLFARRRLADWNRAWRVIEPRWTRQR